MKHFLSIALMFSCALSYGQAKKKPQQAKPAAGAAPEFVTKVENINEYKLKNGLDVLLIPDATQNNVLVNIVYNVGSRHEGYGVSQRKRKRVEEVFGWIKTIALQRKTRFRGLERVGWMFTFAAAAYNLVRMRNLQLSIT